MKTKNRVLKNIVTFGGIAAAAVVFAGCAGGGGTGTTTATGSEASSETSQALKTVSLDVVNSKGETKHYEEKTSAEFLRGVMDELKEDGDFTYEGSESASGIFIESVNNESANYTTDGAYWAIYVNGQYGNSGADSQTVKDGDEFKLVYEKAN